MAAGEERVEEEMLPGTGEEGAESVDTSNTEGLELDPPLLKEEAEEDRDALLVLRGSPLMEGTLECRLLGCRRPDVGRAKVAVVPVVVEEETLMGSSRETSLNREVVDSILSSAEGSGSTSDSFREEEVADEGDDEEEASRVSPDSSSMESSKSTSMRAIMSW